jgi:hypothetical protein
MIKQAVATLSEYYTILLPNFQNPLPHAVFERPEKDASSCVAKVYMYTCILSVKICEKCQKSVKM